MHVWLTVTRLGMGLACSYHIRSSHGWLCTDAHHLLQPYPRRPINADRYVEEQLSMHSQTRLPLAVINLPSSLATCDNQDVPLAVTTVPCALHSARSVTAVSMCPEHEQAGGRCYLSIFEPRQRRDQVLSISAAKLST